MTTTDTILFVKEAKTCSYVLVIHTPRLCSVPGFRSLLDSREEAIIQCREIIDPNTHHVPADPGLVAPEADQPYQLPRRKPVLPVTALHKDVEKQAAAAAAGGHPRSTEDAINAIQRAIKALKAGRPPDAEVQVDDRLAHEGVVLIDNPDGDDVEGVVVGIDGRDDLFDILRAVGFDIRRERGNSKTDEETTPDEDDGEDQVRHDL